jgi:hypothetical protein
MPSFARNKKAAGDGLLPNAITSQPQLQVNSEEHIDVYAGGLICPQI